MARASSHSLSLSSAPIVRRLLVVSHPAVLAVNQLPYAGLRSFGWDPFIVVPARWRHEYQPGAFAPEVLPELRGRVIGRRVALPGRVQRHVYVSNIGKIVRDLRPDAAFLEEEVTAAAAAEWTTVLAPARVPFAAQVDENLERHWPAPARLFRWWTLRNASFLAARSPTAAELVHRVRADIPTPIIPHHVPGWPLRTVGDHSSFVVGYAGRLVPEKGLDVLIDAAAGVDGVLVRLVGNGPLRDELLARARAQSVPIEIVTDIPHERMNEAYAGFGVLVLPSRTTPTWAEQFGRVLVEAMWCEVPVIGADSGEIPWVIEFTGGGLVVPEGEPDALRSAIVRLRDAPERRREFGRRGRARVEQEFSVDAVARKLDAALSAAIAR